MTSDFFIKVVQSKGWMYIGNMFFDNSYTLFPFTSDGRICCSPSAEMIFAVSKVDSTNSMALEFDYIVHDDKYMGLYQTLACIGIEHLQHFDTNLFSYPRITPSGADKFYTPKVITPAEVAALSPDSETGLYPNTDTVGFEDGRVFSYMNLYPDFKDLDRYIGIKVDKYKEFNKNHDVFCKAINEWFGLTDCI